MFLQRDFIFMMFLPHVLITEFLICIICIDDSH